MEDFVADLAELRIRRAALSEQLAKDGSDSVDVRGELRDLDAKIALLEVVIDKRDGAGVRLRKDEATVTDEAAIPETPKGEPYDGSPV